MIQHADQYIAELYTYGYPNRGNAESSYAKHYLDYLLGKRKTAPHGGFLERYGIAHDIRERLKQELAR